MPRSEAEHERVLKLNEESSESNKAEQERMQETVREMGFKMDRLDELLTSRGKELKKCVDQLKLGDKQVGEREQQQKQQLEQHQNFQNRLLQQYQDYQDFQNMIQKLQQKRLRQHQQNLQKHRPA
ncbi:PREDICTED: nucleoporin GLE1-like [Ipomoea nil]|uniref:nucleoporin GLE1-like n=1 Tax=Ipomoea nil TaxID=35883 RepID=UPI000900EC52|nr:PREDICTED: nucleoporin GLE1-like [Ipomoea nil]